MIGALVELFFQVTPLGDLAGVELAAEVGRQHDQITLAMQDDLAVGQFRIVGAGDIPIIEVLFARLQMGHVDGQLHFVLLETDADRPVFAEGQRVFLERLFFAGRLIGGFGLAVFPHVVHPLRHGDVEFHVFIRLGLAGGRAANRLAE